ncbi:MAG: pilus assembly protein [Bradyrhizobium sp.]|nr:MAG: pilus assembly protein [Bradyrhizobium sp.]
MPAQIRARSHAMRIFRRLFEASRRAAADFARREGGGPAAEFALVAPIFAIMIFATAQCAIIYIANAYLETGAEEAARAVLTNQTGTLTVSQFQTAVCADLPALFNCSSVMVGLQQASSETSISTTKPTFNSNGTLSNTLPYTQPAAGQIGVLQVLYQWPVIGLPFGVNFANLGNGTYLMMSTQVFKVEPQ